MRADPMDRAGAAQSCGKPRILVVEDYWLLAMQVQYLLEQEGCEVVGPVGGVAEALEIVASCDLSGAILDVRLGEADSFPVAEALAAKGVPFAFSTGNTAAALPDRFKARPYLPKPIRESMIAGFLDQIRASRA